MFLLVLSSARIDFFLLVTFQMKSNQKSLPLMWTKQ